MSDPFTDDRQGRPSGSELHRVIACPGYLPLKKLHPPPAVADKAKSAEFGDVVHEALAGEDLGDLTIGQFQLKVATDCDKMRSRAVKEVFGDGGFSIIKETRVWCKQGEELLFSCRPDLIAVAPGVGLLVDYKSLPGQVDSAEKNWQILGGIVCIQNELDRGNFRDVIEEPITKWYGAIIQPTISKELSLVEYDSEQVRFSEEVIAHHIAESEIGSPPRIPGPHCKFCPVSAHCVEGQAGSLVTHKTTDISTLTGEQIAEMIPYLSAIEDKCSAIRARAKAMLEEDKGSVPGYQLRDQQGNRYIKDLRSTRDLVKDKLTGEEFASLLSIKFSELRERYVKKVAIGGVTQKAAGEEFDKLIEPVALRGKARKVLEKAKGD